MKLPRDGQLNLYPFVQFTIVCERAKETERLENLDFSL